MSTRRNGVAGEPAAVDDPRVIAALEEYAAALEAGTAPDRAAFLARHADVAEALAGCLTGLEFVHELAPSAASTGPGVGAAVPSAGVASPGACLGDFRLLREVGRGGMGVVYEAEQVSLGRRMALKVLPLAATMDPRQLQRFHNEARAAACLHHTNIVPVYAVPSRWRLRRPGCRGTRPRFVASPSGASRRPRRWTTRTRRASSTATSNRPT